MVGFNGKVTNGAGNPAHKAGLDVEPPAPCVTRKMTPEERKFYGVAPSKPDEKKGVVEGMKKKRGKRIDVKKLASMIEDGFTAADIAEDMDTEEAVIWDRAKARGWVLKLRANEEPEEEPADDDGDEIEQEMTENFRPDGCRFRLGLGGKKPLTEAMSFEEDAEAMLMHYPQDEEMNEYRYIDPLWLDAIAEGLTAGAKKHPGETWKSIPPEEHAARAIRHLNMYRYGDRSESHLINASMRVMMAFVMAEE